MAFLLMPMNKHESLEPAAFWSCKSVPPVARAAIVVRSGNNRAVVPRRAVTAAAPTETDTEVVGARPH
jgi:hypothetical protein